MDKAEATSDNNDVVSIDLPAPLGWSKKFIPKNSGTPRRNEIVFIAPTGEEIKNKRQLDQYLKSHSGGPSATEFDWGTGDTPRRSARLSSKPKEEETPESGPSWKKQKRSRSKKGEHKKEDADEENGSADDEIAADNTEVDKDVELNDVEVHDDGKAHGTKELGQASDEVRLSDVKEVKSEDSQSEEATFVAQIPEETPGDVEEKPVENKPETGNADVMLPENNIAIEEKPKDGNTVVHPAAESAAPNTEIGVNDAAPVNANPGEDKPGAGNSDVLLPENNKAVEEQPSEKKDEPEKELAAAEVCPAADSAAPNNVIGLNDAAPAEAKTENLETKVGSVEVGPNINDAKGNQEAADHTEQKIPVDADNLAP